MTPRSDQHSAETFAVVIPNWNGEAFIERCLGSVLAALRHAGLSAEILVYDDASEDRSPEIIQQQFPRVRLVRGRTNVGFGQAVNRAMRLCQADWVFLLNNDLALRADFCERLITTFSRHSRRAGAAPLFAVGAQTRDWDTQAQNHGGQRAVWRRGMILQEAFDSEEAAPTDFFQAGACLIDRRRFLQLGGFPAIYAPGYWEDYDLAWLAGRRGWVILYDPHAVAYHCGKGSMRRRLGDWGLSLVIRRNHLLFIWANLRDWRLLLRHLLGLGELILRDRPEHGEAGWGRALASALGRLPALLRLRRRRRRAERTAAALCADRLRLS